MVSTVANCWNDEPELSARAEAIWPFHFASPRSRQVLGYSAGFTKFVLTTKAARMPLNGTHTLLT